MKKKKAPKKTAKKPSPKATVKKTATKSTTKKTASKKTAKKATTKKVTQKTKVKSSATKKAASKAMGTKAPAKKASTKKETTSPSQARILLNRRNRTQTPAFVRVRTRKNTPIVFSLEDVQDIIQKRKTETTKAKPATQKKATKAGSTKKKATSAKKRVLGAASITDILGFNPKKKQSWQSMDESRVPKKLLKSYKDLLRLREQVQQGLDYHAKETLKRSSKEDSGDLSSYSQHMADAGTDTFDRDFALSLVSSEQDLLYEIDEAIQRIFDGSYGICEITGKPIPRQRLAAVPFTRYSLEGQREQERIHSRKAERGGIFGELSGEDVASFSDEDTED